jgi:hypothetical protein
MFKNRFILRIILVIHIFIYVSLPVFAQSTKDSQSFYLQPENIQKLPEEIVRQLKKENCLIPQVDYPPYFFNRNVIKGEFAKRGQKDWAVLCSQKGRTHIRVFWGGTTRCSNTLQFFDDDIFLIYSRDGKPLYHRSLSVVGESYIIDHYEAYGGPEPPKITHDAINDAYIEKGSTVHYCHEGNWLELSGAD